MEVSEGSPDTPETARLQQGSDGGDGSATTVAVITSEASSKPEDTEIEPTIEYVTISEATETAENKTGDTFQCNTSDPSRIYDADGQPVNMESLNPREKAVLQAVQKHLASQKKKNENDAEASGSSPEASELSRSDAITSMATTTILSTIETTSQETSQACVSTPVMREDVIESAMSAIGLGGKSGIPQVAQEHTLEPVTDQGKTMYWVNPEASRRGRDRLLDSVGHSYTIKSINKGSITWRCKFRTKKLSCKAQIKQDGSHFKPFGGEHNHDAAGKLIEKEEPPQKVHTVRWDLTPKVQRKETTRNQEKMDTLDTLMNFPFGLDEMPTMVPLDSRIPTVVVVETPFPPPHATKSRRKKSTPRKLPRISPTQEMTDRIWLEEMESLSDCEPDLKDGDELISPQFVEPIREVEPIQETENKDPKENLPELPPKPKLTYRIIPAGSARRMDKLFDSLGYSYTVKRSSIESTTWRCTKRSKKIACAATVKQWGKRFIPSEIEHSHEPLSGEELKTVLTQRLKELAQLHPEIPSAKIAQQQLDELMPLAKVGENVVDPEVPVSQLDQTMSPSTPYSTPKISNLQRKASYLRRKIQEKNPTSLDFKLDHTILPLNFFRDDVKVDRARHLVFATDSQMDLLKQSKLWYVDCALCMENMPFFQLLTIHIFAQKNDVVQQIPVLFVFMSSKTPNDYDAVLESINSVTQGETKVKKVVLQYESAIWDGFASVFPKVKRNGCPCHFQQCVHDAMNELGLLETYEQNQDVAEYVRQLMTLCMIPYQFVGVLFTPLEQKAPTEQLQELCSSFRKMWLQTTVWTLKCISGYDMPVRTKDDTIGWNTKLNKMGWSKASLYWMVRQLYNDCFEQSLGYKAISGKELKKYQGKHGSDFHTRVFRLWKAYKNGAKSPKSLLKSLAEDALY